MRKPRINTIRKLTPPNFINNVIKHSAKSIECYTILDAIDEELLKCVVNLRVNGVQTCSTISGSDIQFEAQWA